MKYDIIIVGGGIVGLICALSIAQNENLTIAVIDKQGFEPSWDESNPAGRVSAITASTQKTLIELNVWSGVLSRRVSPYTGMHVWDGEGSGHIDFDSDSIGESALGHIVENSVIRDALIEEIQKFENISLINSTIDNIDVLDSGINVIIDGSVASTSRAHASRPARATQDFESRELDEDFQGSQNSSAQDPISNILEGQLLIAADGANSYVRKLLNKDISETPYDQYAIVATVQTSRPHNKTAYQVFSNTGPLAFLPLQDSNQSSIVWSQDTERVQELLKLSKAGFEKELTNSFEYKLGDITVLTKPISFPLIERKLGSYVQGRVAFIGDAAHTIHPLAGQGLNLGVQDAICLSGVILNAVKSRRQYYSYHTLRKFERARKGQNLQMARSMQSFKKLFGSQRSPVALIRNIGLRATNNNSFIKRKIIKRAMGLE